MTGTATTVQTNQTAAGVHAELAFLDDNATSFTYSGTYHLLGAR